MAFGIIKVIPASSHIETPLSGVGGGALYPSIKILNPNDGVVYVARDHDCLGIDYGQWDWKVPSQSYAMLPGTFQSVGMFYLDQSGAGRQGEIIVYPSQQKLSEPLFVAIGRALQAQASALDITEGAQPANPGAGVLRLWADASNLLHVLGSAGIDAPIIDTLSTNVLTTAMSQIGSFHKRQLHYDGSGGDVLTGAAIPAGTLTILTNPASLSFNVDDANSIVAFLPRVGVTLTNGAANNLFHLETDVDAGSTFTIGAGGAGPSGFINVFGAGATLITGLTVGGHAVTIRLQNNVAVSGAFCRPNSQPLYEPVVLDVIEFKRAN